MSRKTKPPVALYSALADTTRCRILEILKVAPAPVHVLTAAFAISRPAISRHLRVLKSAGLVAEVKKGRENVYAFRPAKLDAAKSWLALVATAPASGNTPESQAAPASKPKKIIKEKLAHPASAVENVTPVTQPPASKISQMGFDF